MKKKNKVAQLFRGNRIIDDRGELSFNNEINLLGVLRYYLIENHNSNFIRAWHGHKKEEKYIRCIKGAFQVSVVKIDNFKNPNKKLKVETWYLSEKSPDMLYIPGGYANGTKSLEKNSQLLIFSNSSIEETLKDDYRFSYDYWNPWQSKYR
jgi:dTDP-4-dehydrorhamnose 3,5-epimerase